MKNFTRAACSLLPFLLAAAPLAGTLQAQLVSKAVRDASAAVPTRPEGKWAGTARETIENGQALEYAIELDFRGTDDALHLDLRGTAKVPVETETLTVSVRARYAGTFRDRRLAMRSEQIDVIIVETGESVPSAAQSVEATLADGVLTGRVGSDAEGWTTFTAKKAMTRQADGAQRAEGDKGGADGQRAKQGGAAYPTLVLQRREITDPGLGGVTSHTIAVPVGWEFTGGPVWTGNPDSVVTFVGELRASDGASLHFLAEQGFRYSRAQSQQGIFDDTRGQTFPDGAIARHAPRQPGEVAAEVVVPKLRPGATDVRVVQAERLPKLEEALRALIKPQLDMFEAHQAQMRANQMAGVQSDGNTWLVVERSRVRYREQAVDWEEEVQCSLISFHGTVASELIRSENGMWVLADVRTVRAQAGQLDARLGALWVCGDSLRETPRWSAAVAQIKLEISKAKTQGMRDALDEIIRRGVQAATTRAELSDMQMASWRSQQDSLDRVHEARIGALGERQDFRSADGNTWTVTNHYDRAFKNADDSIILTSDPNYRPAADPRVNARTWEEMLRVDPLAR